MTLTTHILTGAVVGKTFSSPWLIIPVSLALHFTLDTFRHGEHTTRNSTRKEIWKPVVDLAIGFLTVYLAMRLGNFSAPEIKNIYIATFFSLLPDALSALYWHTKIPVLKKFWQFHVNLHPYLPYLPKNKLNARNILKDILFSGVAISLLFFL